MSLTGEFAAFAGAVPRRVLDLPFGRSNVWDLGSGRPVVLLHGIAGSRRIFFRVAPLLARARRVIVPLLRGEEEADPRAELETHLGDIAALLESLDLRDATLLGVSFGGYLTLAYAARGDPRVAAAVVQGAFASYRLRRADAWMLPLSRLLPSGLGSRYFAWRVFHGRENALLAQHAPGLETLNADWCAKTPFPTLRARTRLIARRDLADEARRIRIPLAAAQGDLDRVVPRSSFERLRALVPGCRAEVWPGVAHMATLTHPELFLPLV